MRRPGGRHARRTPDHTTNLRRNRRGRTHRAHGRRRNRKSSHRVRSSQRQNPPPTATDAPSGTRTRHRTHPSWTEPAFRGARSIAAFRTSSMSRTGRSSATRTSAYRTRIAIAASRRACARDTRRRVRERIEHALGVSQMKQQCDTADGEQYERNQGKQPTLLALTRRECPREHIRSGSRTAEQGKQE